MDEEDGLNVGPAVQPSEEAMMLKRVLCDVQID